MAGLLLIYGATGYTAQLIVTEAMRLGLRPVLGARDDTKLGVLAGRLGLQARSADLVTPGSMSRVLDGVGVVLNAAGPFSATAEPLIRACLQTRTHYLDISGELDAIGAAATYHAEARQRGVMILPGTGFDVVPSDCLCVHVARRMPAVQTLRIAISGLELLSPGSAKSLAAELGRPTRVRRGGQLVDVEPGTLNRSFDFGRGQRLCTAVSWGDLVSAEYATGVGNIETYFEATPSVRVTVEANRRLGWFYRMPLVKRNIGRQLDWFNTHPTPEQRAARRAAIVVEAESASGRTWASRLNTPEAYTLTASTSVAIANRVLGGDFEPGFQTPARLFGPDFVLGFPGVSRTDSELAVER